LKYDILLGDRIEWEVYNLENFSEQRRHPRIEVEWSVKISKGDDFIEGKTKNVAFDGIFIFCEEPLPLDEIVNISIEPTDQQSMVISGRLIWSDVYGIDDQNTTHGIGLCFVKISDEDRSRFLDRISDLLEE